MDIEVNKENYEEKVIKSDAPIVVDFWGPQCGPCFALMPIIEQLAEEHKNYFRLIKIDASRNRRLCMDLRLLSLPGFIFYRGGREVGRLTGNKVSTEALRDAIRRFVKGEEVPS